VPWEILDVDMHCVSAKRAEGGGRGSEVMGGRDRDRDGGRAEVERESARKDGGHREDDERFRERERERSHLLSDFSK
jgi:hypothetical protein